MNSSELIASSDPYIRQQMASRIIQKALNTAYHLGYVVVADKRLHKGAEINDSVVRLEKSPANAKTRNAR